PFTSREGANAPPFFEIEAAGADRYLCRNLITDAAPRRLDALNAVCDMVAAMSFALIDSQPEHLCLHAGAVEIGGRLVIIPNARRAGKSTLTACLARDGHPVFTDDTLPVRFDAMGRLVGRAGGISPRLRLPLPDTLDHAFRSWVAANPGPDNGQYKYLSLPDLPPSGRTAPLGAIVLLERSEAQPPSLSPVAPETAMDTLLFQNFTREVHSVDVLKLLARMTTTLPVLRLRYGEAPQAADLLAQSFNVWPDPVPSDPVLAGALARADLDTMPAIAVTAGETYRQRPGAAMADVGDALYLSDPEGGRIHRLNPVSQAIWTLLEHPISPEQIRDVLVEAFPDTNPDRIGADVTEFMAGLGAAGLIDRV
ncbi:MAG: PqqD family peptide modification chaperone, partial [Silicimonas sp.]|nr:PqqD family peptide modification chaperone [Silicimonas sp.]